MITKRINRRLVFEQIAGRVIANHAEWGLLSVAELIDWILIIEGVIGIALVISSRLIIEWVMNSRMIIKYVFGRLIVERIICSRLIVERVDVIARLVTVLL